jgi:hypothetical protein
MWTSSCRLRNDEIIPMIVDWIKALIDTSPSLTPDHCGPWSEPLTQVYVVSNGSIALAYLLTAVWLTVIWTKRRRDTRCGWVLVTFTAFILACGFQHICEITLLWWPVYRLLTLISVVSAVLSLATMMWLPWLTGLALNLLSPERFRQITLELEGAIKLKDRAIYDLTGTISVLHRQLNHLERMRRTGLWVADQETALRELKAALDSSIATEASP